MLSHVFLPIMRLQNLFLFMCVAIFLIVWWLLELVTEDVEIPLSKTLLGALIVTAAFALSTFTTSFILYQLWVWLKC